MDYYFFFDWLVGWFWVEREVGGKVFNRTNGNIVIRININ